MTEKACSRCRRVKPLEEFHRSRKGADGRSGQCAECNRSYQKAKRAEDPEGTKRRQREAVRRWREKGGDEVAEREHRQKRAYSKATRWLREKHPAEFEVLYLKAKKEEGVW